MFMSSCITHMTQLDIDSTPHGLVKVVKSVPDAKGQGPKGLAFSLLSRHIHRALHLGCEPVRGLDKLGVNCIYFY